MSGLRRKIGIVGLVFSAGVACTQLFGDGQQNTLAPARPSTAPFAAAPLPAGEAPVPGGICSAGQLRCEGALLQTCSDDLGSWVTVQRCAAAALCQAQPASCLPATCSEDEMTCAGAVLQRCNDDRTGWEVFNTCLSPAHCNAGLRQCLAEPCAAGDRRCDRSQSDQSPVLEVCRDDRSGWDQLDACVTRELCDQTLTSIGPGGLAVGSDGMVQLQPPSDPSTVVQCSLPACAAGETRCDGARLQFCSEGRTGWITAEECASEELCQSSVGSVGASGTPQCVPPACATGEHRCGEGGLLQVCSEDRSGFVDEEQCIGAPFCNAALANQGQSGCTDAPCEAGQMQCNGAQIEVCRDDRTGLDPLGTPCESAALCNAGDPANAFCEDPLCRRGATSGNEFRCEGSQLQRCNESLTLYDTLQTCITAGLCDASQRLSGCRPPVCQPGQFNCANGFLQVCNADQTGFENVENCGSQAQCDANAGSCADPCEPGSTRCNASNGDLERCNDRLTGWQPIADCPNLQLCDAQNARCRICVPNEFSCADGQLRQCDVEGRTFARVNIPPECALTNAGGGGIRACQGNAVVVNPCPLGCQQPENRCRECSPGQTQCVGNGQLRRCGDNGFYGAPTNCSDGNACNGVESCVNNQCVGGAPPNCNDNNQCTNDSCNPASGCVRVGLSSAAQCVNNGTQTLACSNGQLQLTSCTANLGCTGGRCNNCNAGRCANGTQFQTCNNGQLSAAANCPAGQVCQGGGNCVFNCAALNCNDNNPCTNDTCTAQQGCVRTNNTAACSDSNACTAGDTCRNGACQAGAPVSCPAPGQCRVSACSAQSGGCATSNAPDNSPCTGGTCRAGTCVPNQVCTPGATSCSGNSVVICNAAGTATTSQLCTGTTPVCSAGRCVQCVANADCNGRVATNQCTRAQCTNFTCISAVTTGAACSDGFGCNGPDSCRASGDCFPDGPFFDCGEPPPCAAFFGCTEDGTGRPVCSGTPDTLGSFCTLASGARGNCNGTSVNGCDARLPCSINGHCPPSAPSCNGGFCGQIIIQ